MDQMNDYITRLISEGKDGAISNRSNEEELEKAKTLKNVSSPPPREVLTKT